MDYGKLVPLKHSNVLEHFQISIRTLIEEIKKRAHEETIFKAQWNQSVFSEFHGEWIQQKNVEINWKVIK